MEGGDLRLQFADTLDQAGDIVDAYACYSCTFHPRSLQPPLILPVGTIRDPLHIKRRCLRVCLLGTTDFELRVNTSDALGRTATNTMWVDVDGVRASISGPTVVYASEGGGEWTASGRGGYEPYSFDWYLDGTWIMTGPSFSGYPGEGPHGLRADMTDSRGATHSAYFDMTGIGNETCEPVPPAVTC